MPDQFQRRAGQLGKGDFGRTAPTTLADRLAAAGRFVHEDQVGRPTNQAFYAMRDANHAINPALFGAAVERFPVSRNVVDLQGAGPDALVDYQRASAAYEGRPPRARMPAQPTSRLARDAGIDDVGRFQSDAEMRLMDFVKRLQAEGRR